MRAFASLLIADDHVGFVLEALSRSKVECQLLDGPLESVVIMQEVGVQGHDRPKVQIILAGVRVIRGWLDVVGLTDGGGGLVLSTQNFNQDIGQVVEGVGARHSGFCLVASFSLASRPVPCLVCHEVA